VNKGITGIATAVPAIKAVEMATVNGAKSLLWENEIGTIEAGKKADIILIDMDKPHLYPIHDIISSLAYTVQGSDVDTVIVNGKVIMEKREMKTMDVEKIKYNAEKSAESLIKR
jgi:5-methylthioadenosine/S-adenosylhomocysteine deaminase